jgi:DNA-binding NarL/FixJ family response regulator
MIIEDNKLLREGIRVMVKEQKDIQVVAALGDRIKVHDKIKDLKPDVLLLDLGLVNQNSLELVKSLKKKFPKLKMIVMDLLPIQFDIIQFIEEGVSGFILKDATTEDFMNTIRSVAKGDKVFPSQLHGSLFSEIVDNAVNELLDSKLIESIRMTENEKKIIELVSKGFSDKEIAKKLCMTVSIVRGHIDNILEKMSLNTRVQIAVYKNSGGGSFSSSEVKPMKSKILNKKKTKLSVIRNLTGTYNGKVHS